MKEILTANMTRISELARTNTDAYTDAFDYHIAPDSRVRFLENGGRYLERFLSGEPKSPTAFYFMEISKNIRDRNVKALAFHSYLSGNSASITFLAAACFSEGLNVRVLPGDQDVLEQYANNPEPWIKHLEESIPINLPPLAAELLGYSTLMARANRSSTFLN